MDLVRCKSEMAKLEVRREEFERVARDMNLRERQAEQSQNALQHVEAFCIQVPQGLEVFPGPSLSL